MLKQNWFIRFFLFFTRYYNRNNNKYNKCILLFLLIPLYLVFFDGVLVEKIYPSNRLFNLYINFFYRFLYCITRFFP